jgi:phosphatidylglycerol:prolipoprotein diacylglycerol transferase
VPFPNFDPVLIHLGPIAIRWYALAYIAGILLGWRYGVGRPPRRRSPPPRSMT